ncbi:MAG: carboxypeptidase-like regulatory domain-containing protein, partial [Flavobacteriales bacterium]
MKWISKILCVAFFLLSVHSIVAQGRYSGKITDPTGEPVFSVMVVAIDNSALGALTDFEGIFSISVNDDKQHIFKISYLGYEDIFDTLTFTGGKNIVKDYTIREQSVTTGEVVVEAKASRAASTYMEKIRMNSVVSLDYISSETIKKTGDNNVLNAIARVTGVSTGNGLVTVRGIGDR